jgi:DNA repair exonuclease SbcCD ATPase subunit
MALPTTSNSFSLVQYNFTTVLAVSSAMEDLLVADQVEAIERTHYNINVRRAMTDLTLVGKSLQIAYAASKGFKCGPDVIKILSNYQTLVKNSSLACQSFVSGSLKAMQHHVNAVKFAQTNKTDLALKYLARCAIEAHTMATISENLAQQAEQLVSLSTRALTTAASEENLTKEKKAEVQLMIADLEVKKAGLTTTTKLVTERLEAQQKEQKKISDKLTSAKNDRQLIGLLKFAVTPFTKACELLPSFITTLIKDKSIDLESLKQEIADLEKNLLMDEARLKQAKTKEEEDVDHLNIKIIGLKSSLENKRKKLAEHQSLFEQLTADAESQVKSLEELNTQVQAKKDEMEKQQLDAKKELAESIAKLKNTFTTSDQLDRAVRSLDITSKTLAQIKTIFDNSRVYWKSVEEHCKLLKDNETISDFLKAGLVEDFTQEITQSALQWLALANTNKKALEAIAKVDGKVDEIMNNLPTTEEAALLIQQVSDEILIEIKQG